MPILRLKEFHYSDLCYDYDFLFTTKEAASLNIRLSGRPVAFRWEENAKGNPVRRGLYVGSPTCPNHIKYAIKVANRNLRDHRLGELARFSERLLSESRQGWIDTEYHEQRSDFNPDLYGIEYEINPWRLKHYGLLRPHPLTVRRMLHQW